LIFVFRLLARASLATLHRLGALLGWLTWLASPTYRRHLRENMALALGAYSARRVRNAAIANAGRTSLELPRLWLHPLEETVRLVREVRGWDYVEAAQAAGKGILFLTPHLGCFEVTAQYYSHRAPISVLYRPPKQAWLQTMIEEGRARPQLYLAPADLSGVRTLIKALRRGEAVGMLPDQAPRRGEGRWIDFFGRPAYTMTLAGKLSESGAAVVLAWGERLPDGAGFRLHFMPPEHPVEGSVEERAACISREMERLILKCPEQYLWGYNRYKQRRGTEPAPDSES
jgi:KDO2-lipid IV(A) lauroyltransferase